MRHAPVVRVTNFLPEEFRAARVAARWSQERLAEQLGVDRTLIAHWESGRRSPDVDVLDASEVLFGVSAGSLRGAPEVAASEGLGAVRLGRSLSQAEVAERLGLSRSGYAGIERGEFRISAVQASRLAEVLGVDVAVVTEAATVNWAKGDGRRGSKLERRRGRRRELAGERAK
jgi:transcriptional regulator with XRE-family HTH domain